MPMLGSQPQESRVRLRVGVLSESRLLTRSLLEAVVFETEPFVQPGQAEG